MEYVTLVNRSSKPLKGTWNGRHFDVKPGEHMLPRKVAEAIKRQNPIMGTQGFEIWDVQYLVGIKEQGDDISPIEQSDSIELVNPKILHAATIASGKKLETTAGAAGAYRTRNQVAAPLPVGGNIDSGFEKP